MVAYTTNWNATQPRRMTGDGIFEARYLCLRSILSRPTTRERERELQTETNKRTRWSAANSFTLSLGPHLLGLAFQCASTPPPPTCGPWRGSARVLGGAPPCFFSPFGCVAIEESEVNSLATAAACPRWPFARAGLHALKQEGRLAQTHALPKWCGKSLTARRGRAVPRNLRREEGEERSARQMGGLTNGPTEGARVVNSSSNWIARLQSNRLQRAFACSFAAQNQVRLP